MQSESTKPVESPGVSGVLGAHEASITLYANGHKICNICKPKMNRSPTCREQFLNTRNLAVEDLATQVKQPCKYRAYGCTEILNCDAIVGHQAKCRYSPQVCPAAELATGNCSWTGSYSVIKGHFHSKRRIKRLNFCCNTCTY